jgi:NifU-like protein involved in Fe-S cluster formation
VGVVAAPRYSAAVLQRLREPRGAGLWPDGTPAVRTGEAGAEERGILIRLQLRGPADQPAQEARFQAFGCPLAIACASWLTEWTPGQPPAACAALRAEALCEALGIPPGEASAAELALAALRAALAQPAVR